MLIDRLRNFARNDAGAEAIEFALLTPLLLLLTMAPVTFGMTMNNYVMLTNGVSAGARQFSISRAVSTTPMTSTVSTLKSAAPFLKAASLTITLAVNGTTCSSDSTCTTALGTAQGLPSTVSATYPCNLTVLGINFAHSCSLSAQTTMMVE